MSAKKDYRELHVLIVGGKAHAVRTLRTVLNVLGVRVQTIVPDAPIALEMLQHTQFAAVFCDETTPAVDGESLPVAARRSAYVLNPMVPIFLVCASPRRRDVVAARDVGVTDVIVRPFSAATVLRKLDAALIAPRPFIKAGEFFGPDRRASQRPLYKGKERRARSAKKIRVNFSEREFVPV
jgi:two-component system chemotaxis response regulator CheY